MANRYSRGVIGVEWSGILEDISDPANPTDQSIQNYSEILVFFKKPDGTILELEGTDNFADDDETNDMEIVYTDTSSPSILDTTGWWEYTIGVKFSNGIYIKSPYWQGFWVVE